MMQNYCNSIITKDLVKTLNNINLKIKKIHIVFSKDRTKDYLSKRGISDNNIPTNFEIEMPHEIYLADYLVSEGKKNIL